MNTMFSITYHAKYIDSKGVEAILITNNHKILSTKIRRVKFEGSEFSDFTPIESSNNNVIVKFCFTKKNTKPTLCNCIFEIEIPVNLMAIQTNDLFSANLNVVCKIGAERSNEANGLEYENYEFKITLHDKIYTAAADVFETAMHNLQQQWSGNYCFMNCFGCAYSDYSVYGQSAFGSMLCFVENKDEYLKIKNKAAYIEKLANKGTTVQEIFYCEKFTKRLPNTGYRG